MHQSLSLIHLFLYISLTISQTTNHNKILLQDIQVLTFYRGQYTTGRRSSPLPQIECQSGCWQYTPESIQCYNRGFDGSDVNWECMGSLPEGVKFTNVVVGCEGYDYPDDPYVLKGSCQVEFSLTSDHINGQNSSGAGLLLVFLVCAVGLCIGVIAYACGTMKRDTTEGLPRYIPVATATEMGVDTPGGVEYSAPRNPGYNPEYNAPSAPPAPAGGYYGYRTPRSGPGFWTGMGMGGLMGYVLGGNRRGGGSSHSHRNADFRGHHGGGISMRTQSGFARTSRR